jgi:hypothetical protein
MAAAYSISTNKTCTQCGCTEQDKFPKRKGSMCYPCLARRQVEYRKTRSNGYWMDKDKRYALKKRYGISLEHYEGMAAAQGNKCAICGLDPRTVKDWPPHHRVLHVDHDHKTGAVRKLLCNHCNRAVGFLRDDAQLAETVRDYIRAHQIGR